MKHVTLTLALTSLVTLTLTLPVRLYPVSNPATGLVSHKVDLTLAPTLYLALTSTRLQSDSNYNPNPNFDPATGRPTPAAGAAGG